jgi:phenylalanyl-tRNA synthetase beta chain
VGIGFEPGAPGALVTVARGGKPLEVPAEEPTLVAIVPTWRTDLAIEADVAEEIARLAGYDTVPTKTPDTAMPHYRADPLECRDAVRRALAGAGLTEVVTPALVPAVQADRLGWPVDAANGLAGQDAVAGPPVRVRNPLSERHAVLRSGLVASLLDVLAFNERHGRADVAIFEIGKGYARAADDRTEEWWRLGFLLAGAAVPRSWSIDGRPWDLEDAKAIAALISDALGVSAPTFEPYRNGAPLHPGRAARSLVPGHMAGLIGEVHPTTLDAWDLRTERVLVAELAVGGLDAGQLVPPRARAISRHPAVERDLALVVPESTAAGAVAASLRRAAPETVRSIELFDVYRGDPLDSGEKSLAWRLRLQGDEAALTEDDTEAILAALVRIAADEHGARRRT